MRTSNTSRAMRIVKCTVNAFSPGYTIIALRMSSYDPSAPGM